MIHPRQRVVAFLTAFAFLYPQIVGAVEFEHLETGKANDVVKIDDGIIGAVGQAHLIIDQTIYNLEHWESGEANESPFAPVADHHRHCGLHFAGCAAMLNESQRVIASQKRNGSVKPSQQFMIGLIPSFILPPPKRSA